MPTLTKLLRHLPRVLEGLRLRVRKRFVRGHIDGLISVIMPVHNVEAYIDETLRSVLSQSYGRIELIVVDDRSTDGTKARVRRYGRFDARVLILDGSGLGPSAARNLGIERARGEFIAFLDGDDVLLPRAYTDMVGCLTKTGSDFVVGCYERLDQNGAHPAGPWIREAHATDRFGETVHTYPAALVNAVQWSKLYRRDFWDEALLTFPVGGYYQDQPVNSRAFALARGFDVLHRDVVSWRIRHDGSSMTQQARQLQNLNDRLSTCIVAVDILRDLAGEDAARVRLTQFLQNDWGMMSANLVGASDEYWTAFVVAIRTLLDRADAEVWREIHAQYRVLYALLQEDRREVASLYLARSGRDPLMHGVTLTSDGLILELPFWRDREVKLDDGLYLASPGQEATLQARYAMQAEAREQDESARGGAVGER